jgi:hypothetical protein
VQRFHVTGCFKHVFHVSSVAPDSSMSSRTVQGGARAMGCPSASPYLVIYLLKLFTQY